jgi:hypothetical protein
MTARARFEKCPLLRVVLDPSLEEAVCIFDALFSVTIPLLTRDSEQNEGHLGKVTPSDSDGETAAGSEAGSSDGDEPPIERAPASGVRQ